MAAKQQGIHLACRECQRKKVKCSRTFPCVQCTRSGISCKISTRKPRAKSGKSGDAELRERIFKLEKLVETFSGEDGRDTSRSGSISTPHMEESSTSLRLDNNTTASPASSTDATALETSKYVAGAFWSSLTAEVKALADAFAESGSGDEYTPEDSPDAAHTSPDASQAVTVDLELIFCPPGVLYVMPGATLEPDPALASQLLTAYLDYVEPMFRFFHVPSLKAFVLYDRPYLGQPSNAPCNRALKAAIFFAGMNAFSEVDCVALGKPRREMINDYRRMVDIALYQADPLRSMELATLQSLALYVASIRVQDSSRRSWSMVALLDRIGRALGIHNELPGEPIYLRELRRRLWYGVILLDCYSSYDRGSDPTIMPDTHNRPLPSNVNDSDFDEYSTSLVSRVNEMTEMSLALMSHDAVAISLRGTSTLGNAKGQTWQQNLQTAYNLQTYMENTYFRHCDLSNPQHLMIKYAGTSAVNSIILRAVRPMQIDSGTTPPRVDSPWVMGLALNILRHSEDLWRQIKEEWRRMPWVPWHAIAVALAALCSIRGTDLANEAWTLVDKAMIRFAPDVADGVNGMLWRPIEKLHKKAAAFRDGIEMRQTLRAQITVPAVHEKIAYPPDQHAVVQPPLPQIPAGNLMMNASDRTFDLSEDMLTTLPNDTSWLDWESIIKDIDEMKAEDMQWF
ncbi:uncharacterized protein RCC_08312 [Ramularia collo-cygni]|uniref:Zn(2)-C6 fungal-type domain-containing protein n=1 Tax=Ramularia collo-cygni TaxID=112498 RepID=A0A2D3UX73_9PEZI|nr:uncharacterized protein RCC_08312 [Ramularia collo-cygni]CZT22442.1 uncharacterized protein RCC_08312 [Ramularia collo-cygni]